MYLLRFSRIVLSWGWSPILITVLAVVGSRYEWPVEVLAPVLIFVLLVGLVVVVVTTRERELERSSLRLRQLAGYFNRRFAGNSSLSIFVIIDSLFNIDDPKLWDWARACDMSQRIFNNWCDSFVIRLESDTRTGRFSLYLRTYLDELWLINTIYHEFIEQFCDIAQKVEVPPEAIDQYARFVMEYNTFVDNFRDSITELKKTAKTEIEATSVKPARELSVVLPPQPSQPSQPEPRSRDKPVRGYYV